MFQKLMHPKVGVSPGHIVLIVMAVILAVVAVSGISASLELTETRKVGAWIWILVAGSAITDRIGPREAHVPKTLKLVATIIAAIAFLGIWYTPALLISAAISGLFCGIIIWILASAWRHI